MTWPILDINTQWSNMVVHATQNLCLSHNKREGIGFNSMILPAFKRITAQVNTAIPFIVVGAQLFFQTILSLCQADPYISFKSWLLALNSFLQWVHAGRILWYFCLLLELVRFHSRYSESIQIGRDPLNQCLNNFHGWMYLSGWSVI